MRTIAAAVALGFVFALAVRSELAPLAAQSYSNAVEELNRKLRDGDARFTFESRSGYVTSVLDALAVPVESQMLVFSPSSLQAKLINPANPRAVFFSDSVHVGFVRGGDLIEVAVHDADKGVLFYTLDQHTTSLPQFRETTICHSCHKSRETLGVPGLLTFNTSQPAGVSLFATGSVPDHRSPFEQRWGGWYVTGSSGTARHNGNNAATVAAGAGRELASIEGLFDTEGYPSTHSDIAALMVYLHHTHMTNLIARIGWEVRDAQTRQQGFLLRPDETSRIAAQLRDITTEFVDYLLFVDEARLAGGIRSLSGFVEKFRAGTPHDEKGRSLYQLDLTRRLMRYPCSYLIYSPAFDALPSAAKEAIYGRMWQVLSGQENGRRYTTALSPADRRAIVEILVGTKTDLPDYFQPASVSSGSRVREAA